VSRRLIGYLSVAALIVLIVALVVYFGDVVR